MSKAKQDQGSGFYPGVDDWKPHVMKVGTVICQLDYRPEKIINKPNEPLASSYFTDAVINVNKVKGLPSARDFSEKVQVKPFKGVLEKEYTYSGNISFFNVAKNFF